MMNGLGDEGIATESGSSVLDWVKSLPDGSDEDKATSRERRGKVLRKAAYYRNIDVVRILLTAGIQTSSAMDIVNDFSTDGQTALHLVAEGSKQMKMENNSAKSTQDILDIIGVLFEHGADPTMRSGDGATAKQIFIRYNFKIGAALLEVLENILAQNFNPSALNYADIKVLHKELLKWSVQWTEDVRIVECILSMNDSHSSSLLPAGLTVLQHLLAGAEGFNGRTLLHVVANSGNFRMLNVLVSHCELPLNVVANKKWEIVYDERRRVVETPLSLSLCSNTVSHLIDVFNEKQSEGNYLTRIDLSYTRLIRLPMEIYKFEHITSLDVSYCKLKMLALPTATLSKCLNKVTELNISHNFLNSVPIEIFCLPSLKKLNASNNPIISLPEKWWLSKSIEEMNVSQTQIGKLFQLDQSKLVQSLEVTSSPKTMKRILRSRNTVLSESENSMSFLKPSSDTSPLRHLNVSHSSLSKFPRCLACYFPNLKYLYLSVNHLTSCCGINELPALLEELDISNNHLQSEDNDIFSLCTNREELLCHNEVNLDCSLKCTHMQHNSLLKLRTLNLSYNTQLNTLTLHNSNKKMMLFFPQLKKLNLDSCYLTQFPEHLASMACIYSLKINHNDFLIDRHICGLENLTSFSYEGVKDPIVFDLDKFPSVKDKQIFLRQRDATSVPPVKLMFVEHKEENRVSLLYNVVWAGMPTGSARPVSGSVYLDTWIYSPIPDDVKITFYPWDISANEKYFAAYQSFISEKAIYVLCWKTHEGEEGIQKLKEWLLLIKARARHAAVVIVGTDMDVVKKKQTSKLVNYIKELYCNGYYPDIKAIEFVSYKAKHVGTIKSLCQRLYEVAISLKTHLGDRRFTQKLIDMKVPVNYVKLQAEILAALKTKRVLTWEDILSLGALCDLRKSELIVAIRYLKEHGRLMYFDSVELKRLYFDPQWLCKVFTHVVSLTYNNLSATVSKVQLENSLSEMFQLSPEAMECITTLLQDFVLAIPLTANTWLIPSLLQNREPRQVMFGSEQYSFPRKKNISLSFTELEPKKHSRIPFPKPEEMDVDLRPTGLCFRRIFLAFHIPANIWPKLIARLLLTVEVNSFHKIILNNCSTEVSYKPFNTAGDAVIGQLHCKWLYGQNYIELYLGEHLLLRMNALSSFNKESNKKIAISFSKQKLANMLLYQAWRADPVSKPTIDQEGFEVNIPDYVIISRAGQSDDSIHQSEFLSVQLLSHVLEIIDEVLKDWFEGLSSKGVYSDESVSHLIPCPYCFEDYHLIEDVEVSVQSSASHLESSLTCVAFSVQHILQQARTSDTILCPVYGHGDLEIQYLAPDVVFKDVTIEKISENQLTGGRELGIGGFGFVYQMELQTDPVKQVAVKSFIGGKLSSDLPLVYADIRVELNKLITVDHPHIVDLIGLCVTSLSFVLEWAPCGSLKSLLLESYKSSGYHFCPESIFHTIKQVSSALDYLHTKKAIVHYDVKPDNILVFSFPPAGHKCFTSTGSVTCMFCQHKASGVFVKLADLGVSALVGPTGFHRKPATPGHTAPEAIEYAGTEPLSEKVDIYSLGITLYELMTLQLLPPDNFDTTPFGFDYDIKNGLRPPLFIGERDPKYPIILKELVVNCWAQEYAARPTAQEIVSILQSPDCLKLTNTYNTELPYSVVSAALVVTVEDQQSLWLAHTSDDGEHKVTVYKFAELGRSVYMTVDTSVKVKHSVQAICQKSEYVFVASKFGEITVVNAFTFKIEHIHMVEQAELAKQVVTDMVAVDEQDNLIAVIYDGGLVVFTTISLTMSAGVDDITHSFSLFVLSKVAKQQEGSHLSAIAVSFPQICSVEVCRLTSISQTELWCGCGSGVIEVITPPLGGANAVSKIILNTYESSPDIPPDASILQLESFQHSFTSITHLYALHGIGSVISCWVVNEQPTLSTVINLSPHIISPVLILPLENRLFISDTLGSVYEITGSLDDALIKSDICCKHLLGQADMKVHLFALNGNISTNGFLTNVGYVMKNEELESASIKHVPCNVLLAMGAGYQDVFHSAKVMSDPPLHFTTWVTPCPYSR